MNTITFGDFIATFIFLLFGIIVFVLVVAIFKKFKSFSQQQRMFNEKLDTIIKLLENKKP